MNSLFYAVAALLTLGAIGGAWGIFEWHVHGRKHSTILLWALGLLCINWFYIPTLISLTGRHIIISDFNQLYALALPLAFLGFQLTYLGTCFMVGVVRIRTFILLFGWFIAALIFYGFHYLQNIPFASAWPVVLSQALFFIPIFFLNLWVGVVMLARAVRSGPWYVQVGALAYITAAICALLRSRLILFLAFNYPPQFSALTLFSPTLIIIQLAAIVLLMGSFWLLHGEAVATKNL